MKAPLNRKLVLSKDGVGHFVMMSTLVRDRFISLHFFGVNGAVVDMTDLPEEDLETVMGAPGPVEVVLAYRAAVKGAES